MLYHCCTTKIIVRLCNVGTTAKLGSVLQVESLGEGSFHLSSQTMHQNINVQRLSNVYSFTGTIPVFTINYE